MLDGGGDGGGQATTVLPTSTAASVTATQPTSLPTLAPTATIPPEPTATPEPATHTVESGQTLSVIADLYGTTIDVLVELNGLSSPDQLEIGQVLILPPQTEETP